MIDLRFRADIARVTDPLGRGLARARFTANRLTLLGVAVGTVGAWQVTLGHLFAAGAIGTAACLFDLLDGPTAKAAGAASRRGSFLDSVADRVSESIMYFGVVYYCIHFRSLALAYCVLVAYMAAQVTSYARAKADALGVDGKVGFMERAERQITLGLSAFIPHAFAPLMVALAVGTTLTALQRMIVVWMRLSEADGQTGSRRLTLEHRAPPLRRPRRRLARR